MPIPFQNEPTPFRDRGPGRYGFQPAAPGSGRSFAGASVGGILFDAKQAATADAALKKIKEDWKGVGKEAVGVAGVLKKLVELHDAISKKSEQMGDTLKGAMRDAAAGAGAASAGILALTAAASPVAFSTFTKSLEILAGVIGLFFIPAAVTAAMWIQQLIVSISEMDESTIESILEWAKWGSIILVAGVALAALAPVIFIITSALGAVRMALVGVWQAGKLAWRLAGLNAFTAGLVAAAIAAAALAAILAIIAMRNAELEGHAANVNRIVGGGAIAKEEVNLSTAGKAVRERGGETRAGQLQVAEEEFRRLDRAQREATGKYVSRHPTVLGFKEFLKSDEGQQLRELQRQAAVARRIRDELAGGKSFGEIGDVIVGANVRGGAGGKSGKGGSANFAGTIKNAAEGVAQYFKKGGVIDTRQFQAEHMEGLDIRRQAQLASLGGSILDRVHDQQRRLGDQAAQFHEWMRNSLLPVIEEVRRNVDPQNQPRPMR